ncbi:MAG TPA: nucleotidyltransferase family protein [Candidatus Baltobacteraceae bacterium]|jgi:hypothetical protein|nr:nucleotidyltransferase family protein [Candidatus Baltobacteraceae bacterium]
MSTQQLSGFSSVTRSAVVRMALSATGTARIVMRGKSMAPYLRDGMVLEMRALRGPARIGDVVVFEAGSRLVAHRLIRFDGEALICSGDAQPDCTEAVHPHAVLGKVIAVHDPFGNRLDDGAFWAVGRIRARLQRLRSLTMQLSPALRPRAYAGLYDVMRAVVCDDDEALRTAIAAQAPWRLAYAAKRHRCGAAISAALEHLKGDEHAEELQRRLKVERWSAFLQSSRLRSQVGELLTILRAAGIEPIFLKGAQRSLAQSSQTKIFSSVDIDILVAPHLLDAARCALEEAGYRSECTPEVLEYYRTEHHHDVPLYPSSGVPVELHRALAPWQLGVPNEWDQLQPYIMKLDTPAGPVSVLDAIGTALHLTIHAIHRPALREHVLLAQHLRTLSDFDFKRLGGLLSRERRFHIRLDAAMAIAADLAGITIPVGQAAQNMASWVNTRDDLPRPLRRRTDCVDAFLSAPAGRWLAALAASWPHGRMNVVRKASTAAARLCAAGAIAAYVRAMRSGDPAVQTRR